MRVFLSHTGELRQFPRGRSYVAAAERAISAAGHVIVDMADFPATEQPPAELCRERVLSCDVYVGVLGTRYGSPVRSQPDVSYTELEFDTATEAGLPRLVFVLDPHADNPGIPPAWLIDHEFGARQQAFRHRVGELLTTGAFDHPDRLALLVERSLNELTATRRRIDEQLREERLPAHPRPLRAARFVNPPPVLAPRWFSGRGPETDRLAGWLADPAVRMITVTGRGGIGKTATVCRLLAEVEAGRLPVGGIVYLSRNGVHPVEYSSLVTDLLRLLPPATADRLRLRYPSPREMMPALLEELGPPGDPVIVLLDNLESVMDTEHETLAEPALHEALETVLTAPAHPVTVIATTRVAPAALLQIEPAAQRQLRIAEGLGSPDAENVLRELDEDGHLGLRDAPADVLAALRRHTRGFPRALEAIKAILENDPTITPRDLVGRTGELSADRVVRVLVGEAYEGLDAPARQVMRALAVFGAPVPAVAVDFLLTTDAAPVLTRLVRRRLVSFQDGSYHLHPTDRDYARAQPAPDGLTARAADYYASIRTPRADRRTLDDVRPQLAEFALRCDAGDFDTAALVLDDVDAEFLNAWGHYRTLIDLHERIRGRIADPERRGWQAVALANCYFGLSDFPKATELYAEALADAPTDALRSSCLSGLGICAYATGDHRRAVALQEQALALAPDRFSESRYLGNLGNCRLVLGEHEEAAGLYRRTLALAREIGDRHTECASLGNLCVTELATGGYARAAELQTTALTIARDLGNRLNEGIGLGNLGNCRAALGDLAGAESAFLASLAIAEEIGDRHGEACTLTYRAAAVLIAGDPARAVPLLERAIATADAIADVDPAAEARVRLAQALLGTGDPAAALARTEEAETLPFPTVRPAMWLLRGLALRALGAPSAPAFTNALTMADELLTLSKRNVAALQHRALALTALSRPDEATAAMTALHAVTTAPGITAETAALRTLILSR